MTGDPEILFEQHRGLAIATLNRPRALNALSLDMVRALDSRLIAWAADPAVQAVLIKGVGERAFCAGGDIRWLYRTLIEQGPDAATAFYALEYPMNARLRRFPKPYIALLDGITMGGGVGVSVHGSHRVATERTAFAMPETGIGFFPDVGATYVLPRLPGALGRWLGLSGARLGAADCLEAGLATHYVPAGDLPDLERALGEADLGAGAAAVDAVLAAWQAAPPPGELPAIQACLDACFGQPSLAAVLAALAAEPSGWGAAQLELLRTKSPTSLAVTFRQLEAGAKLGFIPAMRLEYRLAHRFMRGHDFKEGVRAVIIDKDHRPAWRPGRVEAIADPEVDAYFAPLPDGELTLP
jgi:enoyl-CoA hydratase